MSTPYNNEQDPRFRRAQLPEQVRTRMGQLELLDSKIDIAADATKPVEIAAKIFESSYVDPAQDIANAAKPALRVINSDATEQARSAIDDAYGRAA